MAEAPPRLRPGETIGVVAPAGAVNPIRLRAGLDRLGERYKVAIAPSITEPPPVSWLADNFRPTYLAARDDVRVDELHAMLANPDVRAIILARGGYGIMRILPQLDPDLLRRDPKPIVGFSDATALLSWAYRAGVRGIHGPMIGQLADLPDEHTRLLVRVLEDPTPLGPRSWALTSHGAGAHVGELIAGNLTLISMLAGTPWSLPLDEAILLIEEVGERPYELDRYVTQLMLTGTLRRVRALLVGDLDKCEQVGDAPHAAIATLRERLASFPTLVGAPVGHGARNEALPFGARCQVDVDRKSVVILDGAVA